MCEPKLQARVLLAHLFALESSQLIAVHGSCLRKGSGCSKRHLDMASDSPGFSVLRGLFL